MNYTLYKIDDKNKIIYFKYEGDIIDNETLSNIKDNYDRLMKFATDNHYTINFVFDNEVNYDDIFSYKKSL